MKRLYRDMVRLLRAGESFAVATIFDKVGSAPRGAGAKMVVRGDGSILGSIGGGRLEADAMRLAQVWRGGRFWTNGGRVDPGNAGCSWVRRTPEPRQNLAVSVVASGFDRLLDGITLPNQNRRSFLDGAPIVVKGV